mmetsp:Transcript_68259/g.79451  ORF Transcript_68259/g.79451 Transcript_68259/m.79451 type:complete len:203 (-) Transcript_68259:190-798(-)
MVSGCFALGWERPPAWVVGPADDELPPLLRDTGVFPARRRLRTALGDESGDSPLCFCVTASLRVIPSNISSRYRKGLSGSVCSAMVPSTTAAVWLLMSCSSLSSARPLSSSPSSEFEESEKGSCDEVLLLDVSADVDDSVDEASSSSSDVVCSEEDAAGDGTTSESSSPLVLPSGVPMAASRAAWVRCSSSPRRLPSNEDWA